MIREYFDGILSEFFQQFFSAIYFRLTHSIFYETFYENNFLITYNLIPTDSRQNYLEYNSSEEIGVITNRPISGSKNLQ